MPKARKYQNKSFQMHDSLGLIFDGKHLPLSVMHMHKHKHATSTRLFCYPCFSDMCIQLW
jgi:hypothetical protein